MQTKSVKKMLVFGAGVMGSSLAQVFAASGIDVDLYDIEEKALKRALGLIEGSLETMAAWGKIPPGEIPAVLSRIRPVSDLSRIAADMDFVLEAVPEVPQIKKEVFSRLSEICPVETVIASNTSALDIFRLAEVKNPGRLIITHFFAPAHIIPLVEVVPGGETTAETVSFAVNLMEKVGKSPIVMKRYGPGFIVNRIQKAIGEACLEMIEEGLVEPAEIDLAVKLTLGIRLPIVGVVQTFDFQGLDMLLDSMKNYGKVYPFVAEKVKNGHLGVKTSRGIYDYQGRSEREILRKRDELYLKMLAHLQAIGAFEPL